jgi:hypothetical protein
MVEIGHSEFWVHTAALFPEILYAAYHDFPSTLEE